MRLLVGPAALVCCLLCAASASADPEETARSANQVLSEVMAIPGRQIPESLIRDAQGIVIVPNVIKIGFIAGVRRGHGVVLVRNDTGEWGLPQFITLTGGSIGWQAGVQDTDVVLVFMTRKSIDGLLRGKFTIGADAAAAAGPVGRNAAAATDGRLRAEILSYSRSRGLFAGLSLDGSVIEVDPTAQVNYYGTGPGQPPARVPESALQLVGALSQLTTADRVPAATVGAPTVAVEPATSSRQVALAKNAKQLTSMVDRSWQQYLQLPKEVYENGARPSVDSLRTALGQYERLTKDSRYRSLTDSPEFQATLQSLRDYLNELSAQASPTLALPPPPVR